MLRQRNPTMRIILVLYFLGYLTEGAVTKEYARKAWWTKKLTNDLYTAGRLTERKLKYAHEAGFKTVVSMWKYDSGERSTGHDDITISTFRAQQIATLAGFRHHALLNTSQNWKSGLPSDLFMDVYEKSEKPVLFYCNSSFESTFTALLSLVRLNKIRNADQQKMTIKDIFAGMAAQGIDYRLHSDIVSLAVKLTKQDLAKPDVPLPEGSGSTLNWGEYWPMKRVYKNWYISGQIHPNHLEKIKQAGIKTIFNSRRGMTVKPDSKPSQEQVTLLNVKSYTDTYKGDPFDKIPLRQTIKELERNRLDTKKPVKYVGPNATVNYAAKNPLEFGDAIGYNEKTERAAVEKSGLKYIHIPIGGQYKYKIEMWNAYGDSLLNAGKSDDGILMQCRTGQRAIVTTLMVVGKQYTKTSDWAFKRAKELGYVLDDDSVKLIKEVLKPSDDNNSSTKMAPVAFVSALFVLIALWV